MANVIAQRQRSERQNIGLTHEEAARLLEAEGENRFAAKKKISPVRIFAGQFHDVMVLILLIAAVISVLIGGWRDAVPIMVIVVMNAALGFIQEYRCEKTLEQMEQLTAPTARVYREGELTTLPAAYMVRGDVFEVEVGERFPCDCVILSQTGLCCDESALTGENVPIEKCAYRGEKQISELNLPYMGYMGTVVLKGKARCEAVALGSTAQMGRISQMMTEIAEEQTPLQKKLGELGRALAAICVGVCVLVFIAGVIRGEDVLNMFFTAVTIAIAAIPEGLPAAVTIALALAVRRMLKQNALVHKLHSVETLGCANVICTDKTGTLTHNQMAVRRVYTLDERARELSFDSEGVPENGEKAENADMGGALRELLICAALCNNARRCTDNSPACRRNRRARRKKLGFEGDPTEVALLRFCTDMGIDLEKLPMERIGEKPFDSESKYMSVTCRDGDGRQAVFAKGAPEKMIAMCTHRFEDGGAVPLEESARAALLRKNEEYAAQGLRVIALCGSAGDTAVFLGLAAMSDPLRPQAAEAVRECRRAGISTVMITGDHKLTACAIAKEAGILTGRKRVVTGSELDEMTDAELAEQIGEIAVYARVTPAHKLRIVRACKQKGMVCAMTGDGVNDAPAVKEASIGVSMGISGTDVTKQAADMILLDDNFATLVSAVREGRTIYANIRKFVRYLIACNIGEVLTMLGAILMGLPMALVPAQLLLVNLVTDGLPAAALSVEPAEKGVMGKPPRREEDSFFSGGLMTKIVARGVAIALCTLACFTLLLPSGLAAARTGAMLTLVFSQLIHVFECRSEDKTLLQMGLRGGKFVVLATLSSAACVVLCMAVPQLAAVFSLTKMSAKQLAISLSFAAAAAVFSTIGSAFRKRV